MPETCGHVESTVSCYKALGTTLFTEAPGHHFGVNNFLGRFAGLCNWTSKLLLKQLKLGYHQTTIGLHAYDDFCLRQEKRVGKKTEFVVALHGDSGRTEYTA